MKKTVLRRYARLIAEKGGNVQKGQDVVITASVEDPVFVQMLVEECYRCGARKVDVDWTFQPISKINMKKCSVKTLSTVEKWQEEKLKWKVDRLPVHIYLESDDPDGLSGIDQNKNSKVSQAKYKIIKPYREAMENKYQWCIAAIPGAAWAKKVFPGESVNRAKEKLWEAILAASRANDDPIAAWDAHNRDLEARCSYLNSLGLEYLEYKASNGTDLKVGLIPDALFMGGSEKTLGKDIEFNPNIPSEEVYVSPMRGSAEGTVYSSKPLSYRGELIENFSLRFENGRVVDVKAEKNEDLLKEMVSMDEGAAYLGECALVPYDSPIRNTEILFYNTLFDENAACHLALGAGFTNVIKDYGKYSVKECHEKGINDSMIHVDFMIGTSDLSIVGVTSDGRRVQIFQNGNWAF